MRRSWVVLASFAAVVTTAPLDAQTIAGTVRAAASPAVGATVRLIELDQTVRTGADGRYRFVGVPQGTYHLSATLSSYAPAMQEVKVDGATASANFDLKASPLPLHEVVVTASPFAVDYAHQFQSAESKGQSAFLSAAGTTFAEKIADLPGVNARQNGSAPARPILRGLGDNEILVLENGLRMGDISTYDPAHATPIQSVGIERVDVVRGPATILYGPSTIGGLVNVVTGLVPVVGSRAVSGSALAIGNSVNDQVAGAFNTVFSGDDQAFRIGAGVTNAGDTRIPSGTYTDPESGKEFTLERMPQTFDRSMEFGGGYAKQGAAMSFGLGVKHYEMDYGIPGVPPNPDWATVPPTTSRIKQTRNTVELRAGRSIDGSPFSALRFDGAYNDYNHSEYPTAQDASGVSEDQANHFHKQEFNGVLQLRQRDAGGWRGTLGLWGNVEDLTIEGDQPLGPNSLTTGIAAYAFEEYAASVETRYQLGLRFDYHKIQTRPFAESTDSVFRTSNESRLSNAFTASAGVVHEFSPGLSGSLSLASSFRAPTVQELFANGLDAASGTYSIGTKTLDPEHGFGIDASLKGSFDGVTFEVSPYVNFIDHFIYAFLRGDTIQDFPVRQFAAAQARLMGFEASLALQATDHLALRASSDYVNAQDTGNDVPLPFIPPLRGLVRATYENGSYSAMAEVRGAASQSRLGDGDTPTDGYAVVNLGAGIRMVTGDAVHRISLHVDNVFNTVYRDNLSVVKDFLPQPARGLRLMYEILY
jgi:iron complex outermembrane receptor protein